MHTTEKKPTAGLQILQYQPARQGVPDGATLAWESYGETTLLLDLRDAPKKGIHG